MTHIRVALPSAQLALDAEHQRLDEAQEGEDPSTKNCPALTNNERQYVVHLLVKEEKEDSGKLRKGSIKEVAEILDVHPRTITRIWKRFVETRSDDSPSGDVSTRKKYSGRKKNPLSDLEALRNVPMEKRCNLRSMAHHSGIPKTTLHRRLGEKAINRVSVHMKPILTQKNKFDQMKWVQSHIQPDGLFDNMYQHIYINKIWFFLKKQNQKFYLLPIEQPPVAKVKSKQFIQKVIFPCAVGRPQWDGQKQM